MKSLLLIVLDVIMLCPTISARRRHAPLQPQQSGSTGAQTPTVAKPVPKPDDDCGCEVKTPTDALAVVNGVKISPKEVDESIKKQVDDLEKQGITARKQELDLEINTRALQGQAKKPGIHHANPRGHLVVNQGQRA